jgi:hypothetical protein
MRNLQFTDEFLEFINQSEANVKTKINYLFEVIKTQSVINSKVAKKLVNTDFYEIRIQVNNECESRVEIIIIVPLGTKYW